MSQPLIKKTSEDRRMVWAEVYVPDVPDTDGEYMDAASIEAMAYKFMKDLNLKKIDVQHANALVEGACVIESFIARKGDPDFIEGAWVVGLHIENDEVWGRIKKGELNGYSLEAYVHKQPVEIEVDIPPVVSGLTSKADDGHEHEFFVTYDEDGTFLGGRTSVVNGHSHLIKRGTATELEQEHNHRFSFVEQMKVVQP